MAQLQADLKLIRQELDGRASVGWVREFVREFSEPIQDAISEIKNLYSAQSQDLKRISGAQEHLTALHERLIQERTQHEHERHALEVEDLKKKLADRSAYGVLKKFGPMAGYILAGGGLVYTIVKAVEAYIHYVATKP